MDCHGEGCPVCRGDGLVIHPNPPEITREGDLLFKAYGWLKNYNVFPGAGGWMNQTSKFIKAVGFCDLMAARMEEKRKERNDKMDLKAKLLGTK